MNSRAFSSVGILALLGLLFHLAPLQNEGGGKRSSAEKDTSAAEKTAAEQLLANFRPKHDGPWWITCHHFGFDRKEKDPEGSLGRFCLDGTNIRRDFMIATIPSPSETRLGHFADSAIESTQRALQTAGWDFDSQWLPWERGLNGDGDKTWINREPDVEEPGLLLFRHGTEALMLVFLVGETPTGGVDQPSLRKALKYGLELSSPGIDRIAIAGPMFSGSAPSLRRQIEGYSYCRTPHVSFDIISGTMSSPDRARDLTKDPATYTEFHGTVHNDAATLRNLRQTVKLLGIASERVTVLAEDETGFGNQGIKDYREIRFPREISALRNSYQEATASGTPGLSTRLPFSLHDADGGEDSVPTLARRYTPQSQYATIGAIVDSLRGTTDLVEILATNVLDALFLAEVIREGAPGTRILLPEADILFVRAAREQGLTGVLSLTTYPILPVNQRWSGTGKRSQLPFADSVSEGIFNAVALLLYRRADAWVGPDSGFPALDYLDPFHHEPPPPQWLVESTLSGFRPIQMFQNVEEDAEWFVKPYKSASNGFHLPSPGRQWWLLLTLALAGLMWCFWLWAKAKLHQSRAVLRRWANSSAYGCWLRAKLHQSRAVLERWANSLADGCWLRAKLDHSREVLERWANSSAQGCCLRAKIFRPRGADLFITLPAGNSAVWQRRFVRGTFASILAILLTLVFPRMPEYLDLPPRVLLLSFNALDLASGASPALPLVLLFAAFLLGFLVHLHRVSLAATRDPWFPVAGLRKALATWMNERRGGVAGLVGGAKGSLAWCATLLVGVSLLVTEPCRYMRTPEGPGYLKLVFGLSFLLLLWIVWSATLFFSIWRQLRGFLTELARIPMEGAFQRIPREYSAAQIWNNAPGRLSYAPFFRCVDCLEELKNVDALRHTAPDQAITYHLDRLEKRRAHLLLAERHQIPENYPAMASVARDCADHLLKTILVKRWEDGKADHKNAGPPTDAAGQVYQLAAEFVALRYSAYIRYVMLHLRNLGWFVSGGFVLLALAVTSLDAQDPAVIRWFLTFLLLPLGALIALPLIEMERNEILSLMADSTPGELNADFFVRFASYGLAPLLGILASHFPSLARFLFSWLQPTLETLK